MHQSNTCNTAQTQFAMQLAMLTKEGSFLIYTRLLKIDFGYHPDNVRLLGKGKTFEDDLGLLTMITMFNLTNLEKCKINLKESTKKQMESICVSLSRIKLYLDGGTVPYFEF